MNSSIIDPLREPHWNQWVLNFPSSSYFHRAQWARILAETTHYPHYYVVLKSEKRITGILAVHEVTTALFGRQGVSLPFSDECHPLLVEEIAADQLIKPMLEVGRKRGWNYLEIRGGNDN